MSDRFSGAFTQVWYAMGRSNLYFGNLTFGQIVTVGNGIAEIGDSFSLILSVTGASLHLIQIFLIDELHQYSDKLNATIHHNLFEILK